MDMLGCTDYTQCPHPHPTLLHPHPIHRTKILPTKKRSVVDYLLIRVANIRLGEGEHCTSAPSHALGVD